MKTVLVTGGAGFIGSHYVRCLLESEREVQVINADALTYSGNPWNLRSLEGHPRHRFVRVDLADSDQVRRLFREHAIHQIVHFAAESHVDRSIRSSAPFVRSNITGTHHLLEAALKHGVEKFVHISTDEVYGSISEGQADESAPLKPSNPYSATKAAADLLCLSFFHTHGLPVVVTRCTNNYGPRQYPEKLIPRIIFRLMNHLPVPIYGDGRQEREWIFVTDHCRAVEQIRLHGTPGTVYNIGTGETLPNLEVARRILAMMGKPESQIRFVEDRPGHDVRYSLDASRIKSELGWEPSVSFDEGLERTVDWYLNHSDWWESVKRRKTGGEQW
ncbi:dTDP-glucose 4,6-dehydratase [Staphylospora marina]|uniref:dTDP-glucose 4,6-dehydratase n=1 Tax=Staphylospora marina TaxID=2490858 RepID=UPI000F5BFEF8|nr:dTDP-glucose 4,6-dehydratase [Staphylospora marina]